MSDRNAGLPHVRIEMDPEAIFTRVYINGEEWKATVKGISVDVDRGGATLVTLKFYGRVTAEGPLALHPWPIIVENEP